MIVILDTNVIVSALLSPAGPPGELMHYWETEKINVAISADLLNELERVLKYSKVARYLRLTDEEVDLFIKRLGLFATVVKPDFSLKVIDKDPDDNRVLECAVAAKAAFIISGDQHLLELKQYRGIVILPPSGFVTWFTTKTY